jgi:hypothetical protein
VWKFRPFLEGEVAGFPTKKSAIQRGALLNDLVRERSKEADEGIFDVIDWLIENYIWEANFVKPLFKWQDPQVSEKPVLRQ